MTQQETSVDNTPYSEDELKHFKERLQEEKKDADQKIENFQDRLDELEEKLDDASSSAAHHQGNIASSEEEREKFYAMIEKQKEKLEEIEVALGKIDTGTYGICDITGDPIQKERLEIKPYARFSVDAAKKETVSDVNSMSVNEAT